jgi:uncharacterized protein YidB (DUF937 family)
MGLMDILNGMQNGPRGQQSPAPAGQSGGMSPILMALLGLLAYKAVKGGGLGNMLGGSTPQPAPAPAPGNSAGGGLGDVLGGMFGGDRPGSAQGGGLGNVLGGLLAGGGAGSMLNSGLGNLLKDLQQNGQGQAADSWVGHGTNEPIDPQDLGRAAGLDNIDELARQTGLPRQQLLDGMSEHLPELVHQLTPNGRLPTEDEAARW